MSRHNTGYRVNMGDVTVSNDTLDNRTHFQLPEELGYCYSESFELEPGIRFSRLHYHPTHTLIEESSAPHGGPVMVLTIGMQGSSLYQSADRSRLLFKAGHTTITAFDSLQGERHYQSDKCVSQIRLIVNEKALNEYLGIERTRQVLAYNGLNQLAFRSNSKATLAHAYALSRYSNLKDNDREHKNHKLNLKIHALSLLAEQFTALAPSPHARSTQLSAADIQRIEQARNLLSLQLDQPITVAYLAT